MTREYRTAAAFKQALEQQRPTLAEAFDAARAFLDPVLSEASDCRWDPSAWSWTGGGE